MAYEKPRSREYLLLLLLVDVLVYKDLAADYSFF